MLRYHDFTTQADADRFLRNLRARGGLGYMLTMSATFHQVREITA